jgi:hypothetical protein
MREDEILNDFIDFIDKNNKCIFGIARDVNYQGYCVGLAEIQNDTDYIWLDKSQFTIDTLNIQYNFDSQGYGDSIVVFALKEDVDITKVQNVIADMEETKIIPTRLFNHQEALEFLNSFKTDGEFVSFEEENSILY